ncbi:MAG: DUF58 domain-containing protein [Gammaproteobacteria bacterium]|nr:DUF58 domain-containing protein [Gammaproteobacteria bacterium]
MNRASTLPTAQGTRVELAQLIALRQEAKRLDITPRGKVLAARSGGHLSRFRGRGMEFDESRVYQPGDDPRNMDWRVTARSGRPHVKLFREERERPVWLLVDRRAGMRFGTRVAFKSVVAARAAALLGWATADQGDRVGGLVFDETRSHWLRPAPANRGVLPLLKALSGDPPAGNDRGHASLDDAGRALVHAVRPGSLVFLLSDFAAVDTVRSAWLTRIGQSSEVVLIHVFDALEAAPPPPGRYPVTDGPRRALLDAGEGALRSAWHRRFETQVAALDELGRRHRAHVLHVRTDQPLVDALATGLGVQRLAGGVAR